MIDAITCSNIATYDHEKLAPLRQFNYIFGSNGTGKTTISRIIADDAFSRDSHIAWKNGRRLKTLVLNRDFIDANFGQLKGVFTLGEEQTEAIKKLEDAYADREKEDNGLKGLYRTLRGDDGDAGLEEELAQAESEFQEKCWAQKQKLGPKLSGAFIGHMGSKKAFADKVRAEHKVNKAESRSVDELERRAELIFGDAPAEHQPIDRPDTAVIVQLEFDPILKKKVIGKEDVDIAAMIRKLDNSDWVRQGWQYLEANDGSCPFCQQRAPSDLALSLAAYFDATFEADSRAIETLRKKYAEEAEGLQDRLRKLTAAAEAFLDIDRLNSQKDALDRITSANRLVLEKKAKEPSRVVELDSIKPILTEIGVIIDAANEQIGKHNHMVKHRASERATLTSEVWRLILDELEVDLKQHVARIDKISRGIAGVNQRISDTTTRIREKQNEIQSLEARMTSIRPTIDKINETLTQFGFESFRLEMGTDKRSYSLTRINGDDASDTLSEGEKTFVVFLYFYHLLKGSTDKSGIGEDRVVVFDDPASSLDSDVLFIVSSLIREICDDARSGHGPVKQVFVLTHNVYFHKEVTYHHRRPNNGTLADETFWLVRRQGSLSKAEAHAQNPVKTSYELLWMEVNNPNPVLIQNTLRRILEHYFTILGTFERLSDIHAEFVGQDQLICRNLLSWLHDGSHSIHDDAHITPSDSMTQMYLRVFKDIFVKTEHGAHYKMMMREEA